MREVTFVGGPWSGFRMSIDGFALWHDKTFAVGIPYGEHPEAAMRWGTARVQKFDAWSNPPRSVPGEIAFYRGEVSRPGSHAINLTYVEA